MKQLLLKFLAWFFPPDTSARADSWESDPVESQSGIHVISNFGADLSVFSVEINEGAVSDALKSVDWENGFHQIVVVLSPGTSMEVGGSLNPEHGLSAVYRNRTERLEAVTKNAPETVSDMEAILLAFLKPGDTWKKDRDFEFWHGGQKA